MSSSSTSQQERSRHDHSRDGRSEHDRQGLIAGLIGDGRPLLSLSGTALFFSGVFGILQATTGYLLPHDSHAIGMDAAVLVHAGNAHLVHFMFHDRVAYCGTLLAIGSAYWWLAAFPLKAGRAWAWWAYAVSGFTGFLSFLAYLGYGYLDIWHACATLLLLPTFLIGLLRSRVCLSGPVKIGQAWSAAMPLENAYARCGRLAIQFCAMAIAVAGLTIIVVGMTVVFVPQDLAFMNLTAAQLRIISPMLIPVIAHDRAGFGGGLLSTGLLIAIITRNAPLSRSYLELIAIMGLFGFGAALGVHVAISYLDLSHLAPAYGGFLLFAAGVLLSALGLSKDRHRPNHI